MGGTQPKTPKIGGRFPWVSVRELKHQEVGWGIGTHGMHSEIHWLGNRNSWDAF